MLRCMKFLCFLPTETTQASTPGLCSCLLPPSTSDCEHEQQSSYSFFENFSQSHRLNGPASDFRYVTLASTALKLDKPSCVLVIDLESPSNHVPQTFPQMPTSVSWHLFPLKSIFMAGQRCCLPSLSLTTVMLFYSSFVIFTETLLSCPPLPLGPSHLPSIPLPLFILSQLLLASAPFKLHTTLIFHETLSRVHLRAWNCLLSEHVHHVCPILLMQWIPLVAWRCHVFLHILSLPLDYTFLKGKCSFQ